MDFEISQEQEELRAAVVSVLEREFPISRVRALVEQGGEPAQAWQSAVELGWPAVPVPECFGGLGLGFAEVALMVEEHGRFLAPGPFLSTVTQFVPALREAGDDAQQERFLGAVVAGKLTGALAVASEDGALFPPKPSLRARADGDSWILEGRRHHVIDGDAADEVVVAASVKEGDGCALFLVPQKAVKTRRVPGLDATRPLATLDFDGVRIGTDRTLGAPGHSLSSEIVTPLVSNNLVVRSRTVFLTIAPSSR